MSRDYTCPWCGAEGDQGSHHAHLEGDGCEVAKLREVIDELRAATPTVELEALRDVAASARSIERAWRLKYPAIADRFPLLRERLARLDAVARVVGRG